jgi:alkylresorcinol/alkylpyrone synthase
VASAGIVAQATAVPRHCVRTEEIWAALRDLRGGRLPRFNGTDDSPTTRYLVEPLENLVCARSQSAQTDAYRRHALELGFNAAAPAIEASGIDRGRIGLVVCVSCTGVILPSLDAELIPRLGLRPDVTRLPITELGCGAGVAALGRAHDYVAAYPERAVLVLAVEVPSLTFQPADRSTDNMVATLVFGDGAGCVVLAGGSRPQAWSIESSGSVLVPEGAPHLGFELRDGGLHVILSRDLPRIIEARLRGSVDDFLAKSGLCIKDVGVIMAHPGGPRVLDAVARALDLESQSLQVSRCVFGRFANASSAGIFFVLAATPPPRTTTHALMVAFGPGLSIELALLRAEP